MLALAAALAACGGSSDSGSPTPSEGPAFTPVPSNVEINLEQADQLYYEGDYEGALTIYSAAAQNGTDPEKQAGLWALAKIQVQRGDNSAAARNITAYRETNPSAERDRQALLLLGTAEFAQGDMDDARDALEEYLARGGPAWPYAQLYLAQIAAADHREDDAVEYIDQSLLAGLPPSANYEALLRLADIHAGDGRTAAALDDYRRAIEDAPTSDDAAEALWFLADAATKGNNTAAASDALADLIADYPASDRALDALGDTRVASNPDVTTFQRALVLFRHRVNDQAATALQSLVDAGDPQAPEAHYYLGILAERSELYDDAIAQYDATISALPPGANDGLRAQAYWDRGTVLERQGLTFDAIDAYAAVSDADPTHEQAPEGLFRAGLLAYTLVRPGDAATYWARLLELDLDTAQKARADFWLSRAYTDLSDPDSAAVYLQAAIEADPLDYYGLRAEAIVTGAMDFPEAARVTPPARDWNDVETWLAGWAGPEDATAKTALFLGEPWLRAVELLDAGLTDRADDEFAALLADNATRPWLLYRLLREIDAFGRPWITSPAALPLMRANAPPEIVQLVYPLEYLSLVQTQSEANGISPLLLLALVRQESLYDPGAVSVANAIGLTQVVPSTAEGIAAELGDSSFNEGDLLRPNVSLRYGAYYLGQLMTGFGGKVSPALAGYNAGPGTAGAWYEAAAGDPDLFLENIEFPETRLYLEVVLENYARYLYAYGFADIPSLPLTPRAISAFAIHHSLFPRLDP